MRWLRIAAMAGSAWCAQAEAADVFTPPVLPDRRPVVNVSVGATYFDRDVTNGLGASIDDINPNFLRQPDNGHEIGAWGITGDLELWAPVDIRHFGGNGYVVATAEGGWVEHDRTIVNVLAPGEFMNILPINGGRTSGPVGAGNDAFLTNTVTTTANAEFTQYGGFVGIGADTGNRDHKLALGIYLSVSELDLDILHSAPLQPVGLIPPGTTLNSTLSEKVDTFSAGPMVMWEGEHQIAPDFSVFGKGRAALLYAGGDLSAAQNTLFAVPTIIGVFPIIGVTDSEDDVAGLAELVVGLSHSDARGIVWSVFGGAQWRNDVYEIVNPRAQPGQNVAIPASYAPGPAHLEQTSLFIYTAGLEVSVPF